MNEAWRYMLAVASTITLISLMFNGVLLVFSLQKSLKEEEKEVDKE